MPDIIEVNNLVKKYADVTAVDGVNFSIHQGEIFSLLGPNGAGKTTTISMLSCLLKPTQGDAAVCGHSINSDSLAVRRCIGVVPQEIALYNTLSGRENLMFWGRMYGMSGAELKKRTAAVLEQIGMSDKADAQIRTYSGGMKRRINIGVGLLHQPQVVFLDEPTVGIDPQSRRSILDSVKELNRQGTTILYTTHYMEEAQELSHRVGIIDHGKMIALGTQKELTKMVGENENLRLHFYEGQNPEALLEALRRLPQVIQASQGDGEIDLVVAEAEEALAPVITKANELGIKVRSVDIQEPNLETVFLHLTGRALRN